MDRDRRHTHSVTLPGEQIVTYSPQESAYLESNIGVSSHHNNSNNDNNNNSKHVPPPPPPPTQNIFPVGYIQPQHLISLQERSMQGSHTSQSLPKYLQDPGPGAMSLPEHVAHVSGHVGPHGNFTTPRRQMARRQERSVEVDRRMMPFMSPGAGTLTRGMTQVPASTWATPRYSAYTWPRHKQRIPESAGQAGLCGSWWRCWLLVLCSLAQALLHGLLGVLLYWLLRHRAESPQLIPFSWLGRSESPRRIENLHSLTMVAGTVYCTGQAILVYVFYNCCQPGCSRLLHLLFISLGAACVTIGTLSAVELDTITASHLVTMHAWCGAAAIFLTAFQVVFGLISFLVLQCYKAEAASGYKVRVLPLHRSLGITTFLLSVTAAITGITQTERRQTDRGDNLVVASNSTSMYEALLYNGLQDEGLVLNILGLIMIVLSVIIPVIIACNQRKSVGLKLR